MNVTLQKLNSVITLRSVDIFDFAGNLLGRTHAIGYIYLLGTGSNLSSVFFLPPWLGCYNLPWAWGQAELSGVYIQNLGALYLAVCSLGFPPSLSGSGGCLKLHLLVPHITEISGYQSLTVPWVLLGLGVGWAKQGVHGAKFTKVLILRLMQVQSQHTRVIASLRRPCLPHASPNPGCCPQSESGTNKKLMPCLFLLPSFDYCPEPAWFYLLSRAFRWLFFYFAQGL